MVRLAALFAVLATLAGCRSSSQTFENPFLGRTTVAPPGTAVPGTLPGAYDPSAPTAPPFDPNAAAPTAAPPATLVPAGAAPAGAAPAGLPQYEPAGGFNYRQTQAAPPVTTQYGAPGAVAAPPPPAFQPQVITSPSGARWGSPSAATAVSPIAAGVAQHDSSTGQLSQASAVLPTDRRTAAPANAAFARDSADSSGAASSGQGLAEPGRLPVDENSVDIMALPPASAARQANRPNSGVERTSYLRAADPADTLAGDEASAARPDDDWAVKVISSPAPAKPTRPANHASYGHDPNYGWLKGRLEYSNIDRRWKLRYIPIDGETDSHGGSVVLADSELLTGFASGDFIAVQGKLGGRSSTAFAPDYEVTRIKRLDP